VRAALVALLLGASLFCAAAHAQQGDTPASRRAAAEALFALPVYRQLATRQLYQAIESLPETQRAKAREGVSDPRVVDALREVIVRSSAQVYSVRELEYLAHMLSAPEAQSFLDKSDTFEATLARELFAAALTNPELHRLFTSP
jgi:hypothetical protein